MKQSAKTPGSVVTKFSETRTTQCHVHCGHMICSSGYPSTEDEGVVILFSQTQTGKEAEKEK